MCAAVAAALRADALPLHLMDPGTRPTDMAVDVYIDTFHRAGFAGIAFNVGTSSYIRYLGTEMDRRGMKLSAIRGTVNLRTPGFDGNPSMDAMFSTLQGFDSIILLNIRSTEFRRSSPDGDDSAVYALRIMSDMASAFGLRIAVEHRAGDWTERIGDVVRIVRKTERPNVGVAFNLIQWLVMGGGAADAVMTEAAPHLMAFILAGANHVSSRSYKTMIRPLDQGDYDWRIVAREATSRGFAGPFILQLHGVDGDHGGHLQRSMDHWRMSIAAP